MFKLNSIKKIMTLNAATFMISFFVTSSAQAQDSEYLKIIAQKTTSIARSSLAILNSWILSDDSKSTPVLQNLFGTVTNLSLQNPKEVTNLQQRLTVDYLSDNGRFKPTPSIENINELTYQTLLGQPYAPIKGTNVNQIKNQREKDIYNYIRYASATNIYHAVPSDTWPGGEDAIRNYKNFYFTVTAIQSFNAYVLGQLYKDSVNGNQLTKKQTELMTQASSNKWFTEVASESRIGNVLRQILMYDSQIYVLLTQLLQTQKQLLSVQAMTNSLLVIGNQFTETTLINRATNAIPQQ